jgi:hypothetical protein
VALTDISLLFKDIIETPQQKQQRLFAEGQAAAGQFTGLPTGLRELAMGTASGIPNMVESVRQFGATAGLPVQTQGEQLQGALSGIDITSPTGQAEMVRALSNIDPARGATAAALFKEENEKAALAKKQAELAALQSQNIQSQITSRDALARRNEEEQIRTTRDREDSRAGMIALVNREPNMSPQDQVDINRLILGGRFDGADGLAEIISLISPEDNWKILAKGANAYNFDTGEWLRSPGDLAAADSDSDNLLEKYGLTGIQYNPSSMVRAQNHFDRTRENANLTPEQIRIAEREALDMLLPRIGEERYVQVTREDEDGNDVIRMVSIPASSQAERDARADLRALNSRNRLLADGAQSGLSAIGRIRADIAKADETGDELVGGFGNIIRSYIPTTDEFALATDLRTLNSIMGLTGLQENREGSASGASGFGQLSDREMTVLQERVAAVLQSSNRDQFLENLKVVEEYLQRQFNRGNTRLTYRQYTNQEPFPEYQQIQSRPDL